MRKVAPPAPFKLTRNPPLAVWLNPLIWLIFLIDFMISLILWPYSAWKRMTPNPKTIQDSDGSWRAAKPLCVPAEGVNTCYDVYQEIYKKWGGFRFQGVRKYLGVHNKKKLFGETSWSTYSEVAIKANNVGSGLVSLGCVPSKTNILIFEDTSAEWSQTFQGCLTQDLTLATAYATLGIESVEGIVKECDIKVVVCNYNNAQKVADITKSCPSLTHIVYTYYNVDPDCQEKNPNPVKNCPNGITCMSFDHLLLQGAEKPKEHVKPKPESNAVIMYTSGSTGPPKGVMLTQANCAAAVAGLANHMSGVFTGGKESFVAYLPMAHILALVAEMTCGWYGFECGYADPKTISSKGAVRQRPDGSFNEMPNWPYPPGAIQEFTPSFFVAVPKIWDILKKGVEEKVGAGSFLKKSIVQAAYASRAFALTHYRDTPIFNLLFKKVKKAMGLERCAAGASGGGPLAADVQEFARVVLDIKLMQGYGLTETAACGTVQAVEDARGLIVGPPQAASAIKVESCPEITDAESKPYMSDDKYHLGVKCIGRGEILIKGPTVAAGYYKRPEESAKAFQKDGWFRTGDIGVIMPDHGVRIVDRVKNLVKLKGGEYIPLEAMEREYSTSVYCDAVSGG